MPLGDQFNNTFYVDENGHEHHFIPNNLGQVTHVMHTTGGRRVIGQQTVTQRNFNSYPSVFTNTPNPNPGGQLSSLQGLLVSPYWGTGMGNDPTVDRDAFDSKALSILGLSSNTGATPAEHHRAVTTSVFPQYKDISKARAQRDVDDLTSAVRESSLTVDALGELHDSISRVAGVNSTPRLLVTVKPTVNTPDEWQMVQDRAPGFIEHNPHFSSRSPQYLSGLYSHKIQLGTRRDRRVTQVDIPERLEASGTGTPIPNPEFWDQLDAGKLGKGLSQSLIRLHSVSDSEWVNTHTGEILSSRGALEGGHSLETLRSQGYVPNIHIGRAPSDFYTKKALPFVSRGGFSDSRTAFHTRYNPSELILEPARTRFKTSWDVDQVDTSPLIHELGHAQDRGLVSSSMRYNNPNNPRGYSTADPRNEGVADGFDDRYSNLLESHLLDTSERFKAKPQGRSSELPGWNYPVPLDIPHAGYGHDYLEWGNDPLGQAQYIAARTHTALGGNVPHPAHVLNAWMEHNADRIGVTPREFVEGHPTHAGHANFVGTQKQKDFVSHLMVGHLIEENPHVRDQLIQHGLGDTAEKAHMTYKLAFGEAPTASSVEMDQPTLPINWGPTRQGTRAERAERRRQEKAN